MTYLHINLIYDGGGGAFYAPPHFVYIFCCNAALRTTRGSPSLLARDLLKKSSGNPYLKICDLMQYFFADAP